MSEMNNIYLNQPDPLLVGRSSYQIPDYAPQQQNYYPMQDFMQGGKDWVNELDTCTRSLDPDTIEALKSNAEYANLSNAIQTAIQDEIVSMVKIKLNGNRDVVENIKKQLSIIRQVKEQTTETQRRNMSELSDYMHNYSHLTFDEYKNIKNGTAGQQQSEPAETKQK